MNHIDIRQMVAYVAGRVRGPDALQVEAHIEICAECKRRVDAHHYIRNNFDKVWDSWTSRNRPGKIIEERVASALTQALESPLPQELVEKMESWLKRVRSSAGIAWCAAVKSTGKIVNVLLERLEELPPMGWDFAQQPLAVHSGVQTNGAVQPSTGPLWVRTRGGTAITPSLSLEKSKTARGYRIRVKSSPLQEPWPLVMLVPEKGGEPVLGRFSEKDEGLVAEFKGLPKADYLVVVEGRKAKKTSPPKPRTRPRK